MKKKMQLSESMTAYLMVLPAVIMIFSIALWPVLQSFWYSMFDLRLNHPTKNAIHLKYQLDMEKYVDTQFYIGKALKDLEKSKGDKDKEKILEISRTLDSIKDDMLKQQSVSERYKAVEELLDAMKPVNDPKLKYAEIGKKDAETYLSRVAGVKEGLLALSEKKDDPAVQASNLMEELRVSIMEPNFIGLDNYKYFLGELTYKNNEMGRLAKALANTLSITLISVFLELVLGIAIALLINRSFKGRGLVRAAILVPWAIPTVVSARMWRFLYDGQTGIIAYWLAKLGIIGDTGVLLTTRLGSFSSVLFADIWKTTPYMALLILAGLQTISEELFEASNIDGASKVQTFFRVTLPLLKPTILVALLFRTLDAFRIFDLIYVLTGGGPGNSTETISIYAYVTMFSQMDFGKGSTLSIVVFLCITLISIIYIKVLGADVMKNGTR